MKLFGNRFLDGTGQIGARLFAIAHAESRNACLYTTAIVIENALGFFLAGIF